MLLLFFFSQICVSLIFRKKSVSALDVLIAFSSGRFPFYLSEAPFFCVLFFTSVFLARPCHGQCFRLPEPSLAAGPLITVQRVKSTIFIVSVFFLGLNEFIPPEILHGMALLLRYFAGSVINRRLYKPLKT